MGELLFGRVLSYIIAFTALARTVKTRTGFSLIILSFLKNTTVFAVRNLTPPEPSFFFRQPSPHFPTSAAGTD
jgi:hypothetical protein